MPLANDYRPNSLDEIVGQEHLVGEGKVFRQFLTNQFLPNMIFMVLQVLEKQPSQRFLLQGKKNSL